MNAPAPDEPEAGRILLFTRGLVVVGLMLDAMVASATAVHLDNKRLYNLADLLAVAAADSGSPNRHLGVVDGGPVLTDDDVAHAVADELAAYPFPGDLPAGLRVVDASTTDGRTARVTLSARSHPPLLAWFTTTVGEGFRLTATSSARSSTGGP